MVPSGRPSLKEIGNGVGFQNSSPGRPGGGTHSGVHGLMLSAEGQSNQIDGDVEIAEEQTTSRWRSKRGSLRHCSENTQKQDGAKAWKRICRRFGGKMQRRCLKLMRKSV